MKQFQFEIRATEWVQAELKTVRTWLDENQSSAVVAYVFAGLIERRKRSGSFVAQPQVQSAILEIHTIAAEVRSMNQPRPSKLASTACRAGRT